MSEVRFVDTTNYMTKLVVPDQPWFIYGNVTNFNYFVTTPLVPATAGEKEYQTNSRKGHSRRAYVGDPQPSSVAATSYSWVDDPGRKLGNAIPGWSFILDDGTEKRQFTTTGEVVTLIAYLDGKMKNPCRLYTQGARYELKATADAG